MVKVETVSEAVPPALIMPVPIGAPPSRKVKEPVGTAPLAAIVAVRITGEDSTEGLALEARTAVVSCLTLCTRMGDVLVLFVASPE